MNDLAHLILSLKILVSPEACRTLCSVFLGSLAGMVLARVGMIHTGIIAQFVLSTLAYAYVGQVRWWLGLMAAFLAGSLVIAAGLASAYVNKRTYILTMYVVSMFSLSVEYAVISSFPGVIGQQISPQVPWPVPWDVTLALAVLACFLAVRVYSILLNTWQTALLLHWLAAPPLTARSLQCARIYRPARLLRASVPLVGFSSALVVISLVLNTFAGETGNAYLAGDYDFIPFCMLLIGIAVGERFEYLAGISMVFTLIYLGMPALPSPLNPKAAFIFYGLLFLVLSRTSASVKRAKT